MATDDDKKDKTYTEIESLFDYVSTSKTSGYVKMRLSAREFKNEETKIRTYDAN